MPRCLYLLLLAGLCACADSPPVRTDALADGVYEVVAMEDDRAALPAASPETRVLIHDGQFIAGGAETPLAYTLVRVPGHAPLLLAEAPTTGEADGRPVLLLTLTPGAGEALKELTSRCERAAVIVGGQIVTVHRIRVPIEGGRLQVSC